jgi:hypothetical protein
MAPANTTVHAPTWTLPEMIAVGHDGSWINDGLLPSVSNPHLFPQFFLTRITGLCAGVALSWDFFFSPQASNARVERPADATSGTKVFDTSISSGFPETKNSAASTMRSDAKLAIRRGASSLQIHLAYVGQQRRLRGSGKAKLLQGGVVALVRPVVR